MLSGGYPALPGASGARISYPRMDIPETAHLRDCCKKLSVDLVPAEAAPMLESICVLV